MGRIFAECILKYHLAVRRHDERCLDKENGELHVTKTVETHAVLTIDGLAVSLSFWISRG